MKRRNLFISFIITIFFVTGCSPVGFDYSDGYTDGILTEEGWENEYFNIRFSLPNGAEMLPESELTDNVLVKTEMGAGLKYDNEEGQTVGAVVMVQVTQLPDGVSDDELYDVRKASVEQQGLNATILSDNDSMIIAGENYDVITAVTESETGNSALKRADRRKGDKLLTITFMYSPEDFDAKLEEAFTPII